MRLLALVLAVMLFSACAPVRFSTEAEKDKANNETRARLGLAPYQETKQDAQDSLKIKRP